MASRPKRVSLKGKGADIFFGDYAPPAPGPAPETTETEAVEAAVTPAPAAPAAPDLPGDQAVPDLWQESKRARKQASTLGSKRDSKQAPTRSRRRGEPPAAEFREAGGVSKVTDDVWAQVETPATVTNSFRYTERELAALADVLYDISKQQGARLTKQDVARLGLNVVLDDYQRRGAASMLGQLASRRRRGRQPGG